MRKLIAISMAIVFTVFAASNAHAVQPDEIMADPARESRARDLSRELRCMVCQNQSIDDSEAPLARDLRLLVRERIAAGDNRRHQCEFARGKQRTAGRAIGRKGGKIVGTFGHLANLQGPESAVRGAGT